jgi:hypothetical protein
MHSSCVAASAGAFIVGCSMALSASPAFACSPSLPVPEPTDPAKVGLDSTPPFIIDVTVDDTKRGDPESGNPCVDELYLRVVAEDEQTPPERLRYRVEGTSEGVSYFLYDEPVRWFFIVPPYDADLRLRIYALDEAGNQSAPFAFSLEEGGDEGCSMSRRRATPGARALAGGLAVALAWLARRRAGDRAARSSCARSAAGTR